MYNNYYKCFTVTSATGRCYYSYYYNDYYKCFTVTPATGRCYYIVLLRDCFHIGLVIGPRPAVLA